MWITLRVFRIMIRFRNRLKVVKGEKIPFYHDCLKNQINYEIFNPE